MLNIRHRDYFITINPKSDIQDLWSSGTYDFDNDELFKFDKSIMSYMSYVVECSKHGHIHAHVMVYFKNACRMSTVKYIYGNTVHCQQWNTKKCRNYIFKFDEKGNTPIWCDEFGRLPHQGERTDWHEIRDMIVDNPNISNRDIYDCYPNMAFMEKGILNLRKAYAPKIDIPINMRNEVESNHSDIIDILKSEPQHRRIIWIWSKTFGVGKTFIGNYIGFMPKTLVCSGRLLDILYAYNDERILYFDFPREYKITSEDLCNLESLSDHRWHLSTKYEVRQKWVAAHVVVLCNIPPPLRLIDRILAFELK